VPCGLSPAEAQVSGSDEHVGGIYQLQAAFDRAKTTQDTVLQDPDRRARQPRVALLRMPRRREFRSPRSVHRGGHVSGRHGRQIARAVGVPGDDGRQGIPAVCRHVLLFL